MDRCIKEERRDRVVPLGSVFVARSLSSWPTTTQNETIKASMQRADLAIRPALSDTVRFADANGSAAY